jgi:hypothetical protein
MYSQDAPLPREAFDVRIMNREVDPPLTSTSSVIGVRNRDQIVVSVDEGNGKSCQDVVERRLAGLIVLILVG